MENDKSKTDGPVEIEVGLESNQIDRIDRLVEEGFFRDKDQAVSDALYFMSNSSEPDPALKERADELEEIGFSVENGDVRRYFEDMTFIVKRYGRLKYMRDGEKEVLDEINLLLSSAFSYLNPDRDEKPTRELIDHSLEYAHKLREIGRGTNYSRIADEFLDTYDRETLEEMLI